MILVTDLQDSDLPKEFLACLPTECETCGAPTEITESLTKLCCSNPVCIEKSVQRLVALLKDLGVKNMGESRCRQFLECYSQINPYAIFLYEPSDGTLYDGCSEEFSATFFDQMNGKRSMLLWEYIKIGNMPGIRDSARKLFSEYDSLEEFYDDLESGGISFVQEKLDIRGSQPDEDDPFGDAVSIRAVDVYNTLLFFKEDLFIALDFVDIQKLSTQVVNVCISTAVGKPYTSKADFVSQMNSEFSDKVHLNFLSSVTRDCQFLIWSKEGSPTNKVNKANSINEKRIAKNIEDGLDENEGLIKILTGTELRKYLLSL